LAFSVFITRIKNYLDFRQKKMPGLLADADRRRDRTVIGINTIVKSYLHYFAPPDCGGGAKSRNPAVRFDSALSGFAVERRLSHRALPCVIDYRGFQPFAQRSE
jgi:hypothetical protein